ncbi:MAG: hypothetical protein BWY99_02156 [Synergistetes bacterium ADurb.BinA166]|nr:MAG: hypothetical protein BWY99_02156 [Synergistetes bacterium ADurb.BinA166]
MKALRVFVDSVPQGAIPVYDVSQYRYPVWTVFRSGNVHKTRGHRGILRLDTIHASGKSVSELRGRVSEYISRMVLEAGFSGTVLVAITESVAIPQEMMWMNFGLLFSSENDDHPESSHPWVPDVIEAVEREAESLISGRVVMEVLEE